MRKPYVVFAFDAERPGGGWEDVLQVDGEILYFATEKEAVKAGRAHLKINFPDSGKYQVVNVCDGTLIGIGGHRTNRKPRK